MLEKEQQIQEDQYELPYHWFLKPDDYYGRVYFGYMRIITGLIKTKNTKINILDAGCGDGRLLCELKNENTCLYGIDYSGKAIEYAKIMIPEAECVVGSVQTLPYQNDFFDVVCSVEVFEHIIPTLLEDVVCEVCRVMKRGGVFIMSVPSLNTPVIDKHYQHFNVIKLTNLLKKDFKEIEFFGQDYAGFSVLKLLYKFLDNRWWCLKTLSSYFNKYVWTKYLNLCPPSLGNRIILRAIKK